MSHEIPPMPPQQPAPQPHQPQYQPPAPQQVYYQQPIYLVPQRAPMSAMAVTGFVIGLVSLLMFVSLIFAAIGAFLGLVGVVFAIVGLTEVRRGRRGRGLAIWGLVLSGLPLALWLLSGLASLVIARIG